MDFQTDVSHTRMRLLASNPWFGHLAMNLRFIESEKVTSTRTNGTNLWINPTYWSNLSAHEKEGVIAKQVFHCAMGHPYRAGRRTKKRWVNACTQVAYNELEKAGFILPEECIADPMFDEKSAEQVYSILPEDEQGDSGNKQQQDPNGDPGDSLGGESPQDSNDDQQQNDKEDDETKEDNTDVSPAGDFVEPEEIPEEGEDGISEQGDNGAMSELDWQIATEQATAICAKNNEMKGGILRQVKKSQQTDTDWRSATQAFIARTVNYDYSYRKPNLRYISSGMYLPGMIKENLPPIVIGVDTSGSITQKMLDLWSSEINTLAALLKPEKIIIVYCDDRVRKIEEVDPLMEEVELKAFGGGMTAFQPVFDAVENLEIDPCALIYLTDLEGPAPKEPEYPVLWAVPHQYPHEGWFGETLKIDYNT